MSQEGVNGVTRRTIKNLYGSNRDSDKDEKGVGPYGKKVSKRTKRGSGVSPETNLQG